MSCKQQQKRIEETIIQPMDQWAQQQEQKCENEPCNWLMLCLNKLVCWLEWVVVKIAIWVTTILVRWIYRIICTAVSLVIGILALFIGNTAIIKQAWNDVLELVQDVLYSSLGALAFITIYVVDGLQTVFGKQKKRPLTGGEKELLWKIFRNSLNYKAISIVYGNAGLLNPWNGAPAYTIGFTIYMPSYSEGILVHECVHVWQFEFEGTKYIGNSLIYQLKGNAPYNWVSSIKGGDSWYTLKSVEAQAQFIQDLYVDGKFISKTTKATVLKSPGAFFNEATETEENYFEYWGDNYTDVANEAWQIIRTG